jgi:hypothetical protein
LNKVIHEQRAICCSAGKAIRRKRQPEKTKEPWTMTRCWLTLLGRGAVRAFGIIIMLAIAGNMPAWLLPAQGGEVVPEEEAINLGGGLAARVVDLRRWTNTLPRWQGALELERQTPDLYLPWLVEKTALELALPGREEGDGAALRTTIRAPGFPGQQAAGSRFALEVVALRGPGTAWALETIGGGEPWFFGAARPCPPGSADEPRVITAVAHKPAYFALEGRMLVELVLLFQNKGTALIDLDRGGTLRAGPASDPGVLLEAGEKLCRPRDFFLPRSLPWAKVAALHWHGLTVCSRLELAAGERVGLFLRPGDESCGLFLFEVPAETTTFRVRVKAKSTTAALPPERP